MRCATALRLAAALAVSALSACGSGGTTPPPSTPEAPMAILLPVGGVLAAGAYFGIRKYRADRPAAA